MKWANSETKPNPENCKNCSSKCAYDCAQLSVHNTAQNSSDNLPSYLQTIIIAQMLSIREEGGNQNNERANLSLINSFSLLAVTNSGWMRTCDNIGYSTTTEHSEAKLLRQLTTHVYTSCYPVLEFLNQLLHGSKHPAIVGIPVSDTSSAHMQGSVCTVKKTEKKFLITLNISLIVCCPEGLSLICRVQRRH